MIDKNTSVKFEIGFIGNRLTLDLPIEDFNRLSKQIKDQKSPWISVAMDRGSQVEIKTQDVQFIKILPKQTKELKKRIGYYLKDICSITGENYDVYRQKIKKENVELDYGTHKRIALTSRSIKNLGLTQDQVKKIESKFGKV